MIADTVEETGTRAATPLANAQTESDTAPAPGQKDSFETFETDFFQAGEDHANLQGTSERLTDFDDSRRGPHPWLSRPSLLGLTAVSTVLSLSACIALWRSNAPAPELPRAIAQRTQPAPPPPATATVDQDPTIAAQVTAAPATATAAMAEVAPAKDEPEATVAPPPADTAARCRTSIREKRNKDILAACPAALDEGANDAEIAVALAKVEFDLGRIAKAHAWSKKAIAINPDAAEAYVFVGGAEQSKGHGKAAKAAYLHYLKLAPSGRYAADLRAIVRSL